VLDEIGELPLHAQPVLLRVLENRQIKPIGADAYTPVDVRVIATTHRDLEGEVAAGRFRADLFFRLSVLRATVPPLRDRLEDIELLVEQQLAERGASLPKSAIVSLFNHMWPGNVRELRNAVERMLIRVDGDEELAVGTQPGAEEEGSFWRGRAGWERAYLVQLMQRSGGNVSRAARDAGLARTHLYHLMKKYGV